MIVTPIPDVVLDVLEAADPVTQRKAAAKLDAMKSSDGDFVATLNSEVEKAKATTGAPADQSPTAEAALGSPNAAAPVRIIKAPSSGEVYRKFEAFVLQVFVET